MQNIAIITGASRGIGRACAVKLAKENVKVVASYNKSEDKAKSLQEELKKEGIDIDIIKVDVTKVDEIKKIVDYTINKYGKIDVLINNARNSTNKIIYRFNRK